MPQNSTGFLPFELLYGRSPRGPLDVLKEMWEGKEKSPESVVSHPSHMRPDGDNEGPARENLVAAAGSMVRQECLPQGGGGWLSNVGPATLVNNKLLAQWQGPYKVLEKIGSVNYTIDMHNRRKRRQIVHVNMLREFYQPSDQTAVGYWCEEADSDGQEEEVPVW